MVGEAMEASWPHTVSPSTPYQTSPPSSAAPRRHRGAGLAADAEVSRCSQSHRSVNGDAEEIAELAETAERDGESMLRAGGGVLLYSPTRRVLRRHVPKIRPSGPTSFRRTGDPIIAPHRDLSSGAYVGQNSTQLSRPHRHITTEYMTSLLTCSETASKSW